MQSLPTFILGLIVIACMLWTGVADITGRKERVPVAIRIGDLLGSLWVLGYIAWLVVQDIGK